MRIKLDENLPVRLVSVLTELGHDVDTVPSQVEDVEHWGGCMVTATPHKVRVRRPAPDTAGDGHP